MTTTICQIKISQIPYSLTTNDGMEIKFYFKEESKFVYFEYNKKESEMPGLKKYPDDVYTVYRLDDGSIVIEHNPKDLKSMWYTTLEPDGTALYRWVANK